MKKTILFLVFVTIAYLQSFSAINESIVAEVPLLGYLNVSNIAVYNSKGSATFSYSTSYTEVGWVKVTIKANVTVSGDYQWRVRFSGTNTAGQTSTWNVYSETYTVVAGNNSNQNDRTLYGDVNGDGDDELVLVNVSCSAGAIRAVKINANGNAIWIQYNSSFEDYFDSSSDKMFMADANGDGIDELVLVDYEGKIVRVINMITGANYSLLSNITFSSLFPPVIDWNDAKLLVGDINGDNKDELIFVGSSSDILTPAIISVNLTNGSKTSIGKSSGFLNGWVDSSDKMFIGDINADNKDELVLVNTTLSGGAIRAINLSTGTNVALINHGDVTSFNGWMDETDRMFLKDINADNKADLVFVNTSYNSGAIRAVNILTGGNLCWINHGSFGGWMDSNDRMLMLDANGDGMKDICFINTSYTNGAIKVHDIMTESDIFLKDHSELGLTGWLDGICPYTTNSVSLKSLVAETIDIEEVTEATDIEQDIENLNNLILYPNPNNGNFTIENLDINSIIEIYNTNGVLIKRITDNQESKVFINLQDITAGLYFIHFKNNSSVISRKIIIE